MIPPLAAVVLALALSHAVPDRAPHAVVETRQTAIRPSGTALHGLSTWYRYVDGQAAAGPALRAFLGANWRGTVVTVTANGHSVTARLTDFCQCPGGRVIDLDRRSFAALVGFLVAKVAAR